jgi:hypothetical protein
VRSGRERRILATGNEAWTPRGGLRVRVFVGADLLTNRWRFLTEVIPPGPETAREAENARTCLLSRVGEPRNPRSGATVDRLLDLWFEVLDLEPSTRLGDMRKMDDHRSSH